MEEGESEKNIYSESERSNLEEACEEIKFTRCQIIKNLVVISTGFLLIFTAYNGLSMLQSTINQAHGIGVASQAIIYAGFCVSALLLPKYSIKKLGCKRTLLFSMICYIPYIISNFWFNWVTMIPSAIMNGLAASTLWSSKCTYLNESAVVFTKLSMKDNIVHKQSNKVSEKFNDTAENKENQIVVSDYEKKSPLEYIDCTKLYDTHVPKKHIRGILHLENNSENQNFVKNLHNISVTVSDVKEFKLNVPKCQNISPEATSKANELDSYPNLVSSVTARFFGFFGLVYRTSDIWSNLMSYYVLNDNALLDNVTGSGNCTCGSYFCNIESNCFEHNLAEPSQQMRNILTGVSVILAVLAIVIVTLFLDELGNDKEPTTKITLDLALSTCKFAMKKEALLLIPLSAYIGLQQGFYIGDFTKSYIACAWGVYHVGLVTISYGISAGISATLAGFLVKYIGRTSVIVIGAVANAVVCIFLLVWKPVPDEPLLLFFAAGLWGVSVGILWSQLRAYYGVLFQEEEEAAFAGFYMWDSIGYCLSFSYSNYICTYIKLYILLVVSTLGTIGYLKTEFMNCQRYKKSPR